MIPWSQPDHFSCLPILKLYVISSRCFPKSAWPDFRVSTSSGCTWFVLDEVSLTIFPCFHILRGYVICARWFPEVSLTGYPCFRILLICSRFFPEVCLRLYVICSRCFSNSAWPDLRVSISSGRTWFVLDDSLKLGWPFLIVFTSSALRDLFPTFPWINLTIFPSGCTWSVLHSFPLKSACLRILRLYVIRSWCSAEVSLTRFHCLRILSLYVMYSRCLSEVGVTVFNCFHILSVYVICFNISLNQPDHFFLQVVRDLVHHSFLQSAWQNLSPHPQLVRDVFSMIPWSQPDQFSLFAHPQYVRDFFSMIPWS